MEWLDVIAERIRLQTEKLKEELHVDITNEQK